ncbi:MAG: ribonuclease Z [Nanoarchaeota archaeon]|nr:ribonuclease Z [Nanoarchaeota archaeon]
MTIKITFLGTADQVPSASRNHTAVLLTYKGENILIDCGEGTQRQFRKAKLNPCKVDKILITHWHGDHIFGLPGFLSTLALSGYNKKLIIYGPKRTETFVKELLKVFNFERKYQIEVKEISGKFFETDEFYLEAEKMEHGIPTNAYCFVKKDQIRINKEKLKKSKVPSSPLISKLKAGKNISYEGKKYFAKDLTYLEKGKKVSFVFDTRLNKRIVPFVKDSDLLVCEASYEAEMENQAKEHLHLTSVQAAEIAKKSKSDKLILTHISQRYDKNLKKILDESQKVFKNSELAKDLDNFEI